MNVYDSTRMQDALESDGYTATSDMSDADLVLLNTCHIREKAAEKVYSGLGRVRKLKESRAETDRPLLVGVTGCVAQAEGKEIITRDRSVDMVIGPQSYHDLPIIIERAKGGKPQIVTDFAVDDKFAQPLATPKQVKSQGVTAFLTVQEGCDKFCTFCVVPYTRGAEVSRPRTQILEQARSSHEFGCPRNHVIRTECKCVARHELPWFPYRLRRVTPRIIRDRWFISSSLCHESPLRYG